MVKHLDLNSVLNIELFVAHSAASSLEVQWKYDERSKPVTADVLKEILGPGRHRSRKFILTTPQWVKSRLTSLLTGLSPFGMVIFDEFHDTGRIFTGYFSTLRKIGCYSYRPL